MGKKLKIGAGIIAVVVIVYALLQSGILTGVIPKPSLNVSVTTGSNELFRASIHVTVTNNGGASATGVTLVVGSSGDSKSGSLGTLNPGESKSEDFTFVLVRGGPYDFYATATCVEGNSDTETFTVQVKGF
jgi:hypothetical protein